MSTPMQEQYDKLKKKHEDCILLYRLGDFYEGFDNDAKILSKVLNIVLTKRGKGINSKPMAGIPYHALDNYLPKLVKAGYKIAIVEQLEKPQKGKKLVDRDIVKIVSAGTITNEKSLNENQNNFISVISYFKEKGFYTYGVSVCDLTTGEFFIFELYTDDLNNIDSLVIELKIINPSEIIVQESLYQTIKNKINFASIQKLPNIDFIFNESNRILLKHFKVLNLKGFGIEKYKAGIISAGINLKYLLETQKASLTHINKIYYKNLSKYMILDENTIRSLEITYSLRPDSNNTLIKIIDKCQTSMGRRKLYNWILNPLLEKKDIEERLNSVEELFNDSIKLECIRSILDNIYDLERILGKIGNENINARDLIALKDSLINTNKISKELNKFRSYIINKIYINIIHTKSINDVIKLIEISILDNPPFKITEGNIIKHGYNKELDNIKEASINGKTWIKKLQQEEAIKTGIQSLKVKFNKIFGYYIEITKSNLKKVPSNYIRKQTLINAERFITPELKDKEEMILHSEERSFDLEYKIFTDIRNKISKYLKHLQSIAYDIALLDCISNFAYIARRNDYTRPIIKKSSNNLINIVQGRHPVVENINNEVFISNNTKLDTKDNQIAIITGPNMSGKSTYIRQVALIILLAQIGSFVSAEKMEFEPVDRIFTRISSNDNLSKGESTFLVEMNEMANILNNATNKSLIVLDEVGRGTSTYDGVAIAWAVVEYIHDKIGSKTLFATHYHELVDLEKYLQRVKNYNVAVRETKNKILFLRKILKGGTDKSYGIYVASLAGLPIEILNKAREILLSLEQEGIFEVKHIESELSQKKKSYQKQLFLDVKLPENIIIRELKDLEINNLTPLEALKKLNDLINKSKDM